MAPDERATKVLAPYDEQLPAEVAIGLHESIADEVALAEAAERGRVAALLDHEAAACEGVGDNRAGAVLRAVAERLRRGKDGA